MRYYFNLIVSLVIVVLFAAVASSIVRSAPLPTEGKARVGETVTARFVCKDEGLLKGILSGESDTVIVESANLAVSMSLCGWSDNAFSVTLLEYMGWVEMKLEPPGKAHIYRVEDPGGDSHYMYMFIEQRPV